MLFFATPAQTTPRKLARDLARAFRAALLVFVAIAFMLGSVARAQEVVDRIIARIEGDVLLQSDLRELGEFQQLQGTKVEPESTRMTELIDQWVIAQEGEAAQFSQPSDADVNASLDQLKENLGGEEVFQKRLKETGLSVASVRRILARVLFYSRYLDYKFRTAAQIDSAAEEKYYNTEFAEQLKARGEKSPPLDSVRPQIHELLVQEDISKRAAEWLTESRSRLKIELVPATGAAPPAKQLENE
jgi:peptidyl-prolyl cis-trans isomerase SurA